MATPAPMITSSPMAPNHKTARRRSRPPVTVRSLRPGGSGRKSTALDAGRDGDRTTSAQAARILLQGGVNSESSGYHQAAEGALQSPLDLNDVIVSGGEQSLCQALPGLGDPGDLRSRAVLDVEVPGSPVLGIDRAQRLAAGFQGEADLPNDVLLHDLTDLAANIVFDDDSRLEKLRRPRESQQDRTRDIHDLQARREELVQRGEESQRLPHRALSHLPDGADLIRVAIEDRVLVCHLDDLRLLADDEDRLCEESSTALGGRPFGTRPCDIGPDLLGRTLDGRDGGSTEGFIHRGNPSSGDIGRPRPPIPVPHLVTAKWVGIPTRRRPSPLAHASTVPR